MLYFEDFSGVHGVIRSNPAFYVNDRNFIFETFNSITSKAYFEASGAISYTDGSSNYTFETEMSSSGFSNISSVLRGSLCDKFDEVKECSLTLNFIYKYPGEYSRCNKARDVRLWYNSITGRMYLSKTAKRLLYIADALPAVSCTLAELLENVTFESASCAGIAESDLYFAYDYIDFFNTHMSKQLVFKGNFFSWPVSTKVTNILEYLSEDNTRKGIAVGVLQSGELCFLTRDDIQSNVLSSNALGVQYIYAECFDAVTRATWDGSEVCAVPLALDSIGYVKKCLGGDK